MDSAKTRSPQLGTVPGRLCRWILGPEAEPREDPDAIRRSQFLALATSLTALVALLAMGLHWLEGEHVRAMYALFATPLVFAGVVVYRRTRNTTLAAHVFCVTASLLTITSPFLAPKALPLPLALLGMPLAAAAIGNARAGTLWTGLTVIAFMAYGYAAPAGSDAAALAWLSTLVAVACGTGAVVFETGRARALAESRSATAEAKADAEHRRRAEIALRESQQLFSAAFNQAPSIMLLADLANGKILDINEAFATLSGWGREEAVGQTLTELGAWPNTEERDKLAEVVLERGTTRTVELQLRRRGGEAVWLLASAEILKQDDRALLLAQGIDISERKQAEEERERLTQELEIRFADRGRLLEDSLVRLREQDRLSSIGTLAAGIAHQINNPIGGIVAATQFALMTDEGASSSTVETEALRTALAEAKRCGRIVKNVLKFARDEPTAKWVEDLSAEVLRACHLARPYARARGTLIEVDCEKTDLPVRMSPIDIEQALMNILRNAAEASPGATRVEVKTRRAGDQAQVIISDDGPGIDESLRSRVLDPFFTSRQEDGGTGLGLSVAHGVLQDHGGSVRIDSSPGGGTRVLLELPLAEFSLAQPSADVAAGVGADRQGMAERAPESLLGTSPLAEAASLEQPSHDADGLR